MKKRGKIFICAYGQGRQGCHPSPSTVSLTVKYPPFFYDSPKQDLKWILTLVNFASYPWEEMLNVYVKCQSTFFRTFPFWIDMSRDPDDDNAILITNNKRSSTVALTSCYIRQSVRVSLFRFFVLTQTGTVFCFRSKEKLLTRRYLNVFSFEIKADSVQKYLHNERRNTQ